LTLGLHEACSENHVTAGLIGFYPEFIIPYGTVATVASRALQQHGHCGHVELRA
jgi:hypothetical protein